MDAELPPPVPLLPDAARSARDRTQPEIVAEARTTLPRRRAAPAKLDSPLETTATPPSPPEDHIPTAKADSSATQPPGSAIDVYEVAVRVAGYNLAVATLVEDIQQARRPSRDELAALVARAETLALRAEDLAPYFPLVAESDRPRLGELAPLAPAFAALQQQLDATGPHDSLQRRLDAINPE